jgi:hypothetical protein
MIILKMSEQNLSYSVNVATNTSPFYSVGEQMVKAYQKHFAL